MKFFIDTEFHEYKRTVSYIFKANQHFDTIEMISIGIVSEDGNEYYAICKDFDVDAAWKNEWLRENVLKKIYSQLVSMEGVYTKTYYPGLMDFTPKGLSWLLDAHGKTREIIAQEVKEFVYVNSDGNPPQFFGYYADYDHVVFCWLFGRMIDLPKGFPMYTIDLKQKMDEMLLDDNWLNINNPSSELEHDALEDAKWNLKLYHSIQSYKQISPRINEKGLWA